MKKKKKNYKKEKLSSPHQVSGRFEGRMKREDSQRESGNWGLPGELYSHFPEREIGLQWALGADSKVEK